MLTQVNANYLIALEKIRQDDSVHSFPSFGGSVVIGLQSRDGREKFLLDLSRQRLNLKKIKYQKRLSPSEVLVRLDLDGAPHRNPDGEEVACPHLHIYREGWGDKWATAVPNTLLVNPENLPGTLESFLAYCNVVQPPVIEMGLGG